jgi:hypothetical protein
LPLFHGGNTGSNPVGDANYLNRLRDALVDSVQNMANICG